MPHSRRDQTRDRRGGAANLFDPPVNPIDQRERARLKRLREEAKRKEDAETEGNVPIGEFVHGRSTFTPLQILLQEDRISPQKGFLGEFIEGGKAVARAGFEVISEAGDSLFLRGEGRQRNLFDIKNPLHRPGEGISSNPNLQSKALAFDRAFGLGVLDEEKDKDVDKAADKDPSTGDSAIATIHAESRRLEEGIRLADQTIGVLSEGTTDPEAQLERENIIEGLELEKAEKENQLLELQDQLAVQNAIFDISAENAGLEDVLGDIEPLTAALVEEQSLGSLTYRAIQEIAENAALSEKERNEAIDIVLTRQRFSEEIIKTINDVVQNSKNLDELIANFKADEIFDVGAFLDPSLSFDVDGDNDSQRFQANMENVVDGLIQAPIRIPENDETFGDFTAIILGSMKFGLDNELVQNDIAALAPKWDLSIEEMTDALAAGIKFALESQEIWDKVADQDQLIPGSRGMIAAIYQAGEEIGFDPELLSLNSRSAALHALIDVQSKGRSGIMGDGTIAGVGGLTLDVYDEVMEGPWTPERGMSWELQALLEYIRRRFDGDALRAITFWRDTGEWGGTEAMPGPGPTPGSRADLQAGG